MQTTDPNVLKKSPFVIPQSDPNAPLKMIPLCNFAVNPFTSFEYFVGGVLSTTDGATINDFLCYHVEQYVSLKQDLTAIQLERDVLTRDLHIYRENYKELQRELSDLRRAVVRGVPNSQSPDAPESVEGDL